MTTRPRIVLLIGAAALALLVAIGARQLASSRGGGSQQLERLSAEQIAARLAGSPPPLGALHEQAGELLEGGAVALRRRLHALRGYPVVINKWASWCAPCRAELPIFEHASANLGRRVAFIGLDSVEAERSNALALLRSLPLGYPSYYDPSGAVGEQLTFSPFTPVTVFIAPDGSTYRHQGPYPTLQKLERDVERYGADA
jgi:cytochrome c biogenesis protein CcmG/thiol:disulfide interchange protein DsbE